MLRRLATGGACSGVAVVWRSRAAGRWRAPRQPVRSGPSRDRRAGFTGLAGLQRRWPSRWPSRWPGGAGGGRVVGGWVVFHGRGGSWQPCDYLITVGPGRPRQACHLDLTHTRGYGAAPARPTRHTFYRSTDPTDPCGTSARRPQSSRANACFTWHSRCPHLRVADVPKEQSVSIMLNGEESELQFVNIGNLKVGC